MVRAGRLREKHGATRVFRDRPMKDLAHAKDVGLSPKRKGKPSHFITYHPTHPSQAFPERSVTRGKIRKQHHL